MWAFNPTNNPDLEINHINAIKHDNRLENLEWVTHAENVNHSIRLGLKFIPRGEVHANSKLNNLQVTEIKKLAVSKVLSYIKIAKIFCVYPSTIRRIVINETWSHIQL